MDPLIIAGCAFGGSIITGIIGWMKSGGPFVPRDFMGTILSGIGGAIVFALAYSYTTTGLTAFDYLGAIAGGMAANGLRSGISGAIAVRAAKLNK